MALAALSYPETRAAAIANPPRPVAPSPEHEHTLPPDEQLECFDFTYDGKEDCSSSVIRYFYLSVNLQSGYMKLGNGNMNGLRLGRKWGGMLVLIQISSVLRKVWSNVHLAYQNLHLYPS